MRTLVIGGTGFIGRHYVARLLADGHDVTVVSRAHQPLDDEVLRHCEWAHGGLGAVIKSPSILGQFDQVCHLASTVVPATSNADPAGDINENLIQLVKLLEAMRDHGPRQLVYLSSGGAVYGNPNYVPMDEEHPKNPLSSYGIVKAAGEAYCRMFETQHGIRTAIIRPSNPYGPGQRSIGQLGVVTTFLAMARDQVPVTLFGDGSLVRDFVFVSDLVDLMHLVTVEQVSGTFNCGSGVGTSLAALLDEIEEVTGTRISRVHKPLRGFDPPEVILDISRAKAGLGWEPKVALSKGIELTWRAMTA